MGQQLNNKDMLVRVLDKTDKTHDVVTRLEQVVEQVLKHNLDQNHSIAKAHKEIAALEKKVISEDEKVIKKLSWYGCMALIAASFIFIKESRDVIIKTLF